LTGVADRCAPSRSGQWPTEKAMIEALLADGYAIVATDFEGLGTPGAPLPGEGNSEAYNMIDIVRAGRTIAPLSRSWIVAGYSGGGHAALFAGALAKRYAPELNHLGTIAMAPVSQWRVQMESPANRDPAAQVSFASLYWATSAAALHPGRFVPAMVFTERGLQVLDQARSLCVLDLIAAITGVTNGDVYQNPATAASLTAELLADDEVPVIQFPRPLRIAQGRNDPLLPLTDLTAAQLEQAGNDLVYLPVEGADHTTLATAIGPQLRVWVRELFAVPRQERVVVG
jgi:pimeloyl-ACP methyl ester carboxylesterase